MVENDGRQVGGGRMQHSKKKISAIAVDYPVGLAQADGRNQRLRQLLEEGLLLAPGAYDCITARLIERAGFAALYISGSGMSLSMLGAPDIGLTSFHEIIDRAKRIADSVSIPVLCDGDTGYGGPLNVIRTVREFERAGISAIQLEDQMWPKKCGHQPDRKLVETDEMIGRIKAAVDARTDADFAIIARTDARASLGLDAAIDRAKAYREAGADILFVEAPESEDEMRRINQDLGAPTLANMVEGGRTPIFPTDHLADIGYRVVIYPNALSRLFTKAGGALLDTLRETGSTAAMAGSMYGLDEFFALFEYQRWIDIEKRYSGD